MTEVKTIIPARLKSGVVNGYVTGAADIIDDDKGLSQAAINAAVDTEIGDDETEGSIKGRIKNLEESIGPGGSVEEQIQAAIAELDSTKSQAAGADGLALSITETNGKITVISGSIAANTYDAYGSAAAERTRAEGAEQTLQGNINSEASRATGAESDLQEAIDAEKTRAKAAEQANATAIATEKTRAEGAEGTLTTNLASEVTRATGAEQTLQTNITAEENRATTAEELIDGRLDAVEEVIPSAATSTNQLADKEFVNSSISTSTATFRGTSATGLTEAEFLEWANSLTKDANDYVFWNTVDAAGTPQFKRYKYNGTTWIYEYTLNNSSFTADQWATINSLLTSAHKTKLDALPTNAELTTLFADKEDVISDLATIRSGAALGATAYQKPSSGIPSTDLTSAVQTSLGKADTAVQPQNLDSYYTKPQTDTLLNGKQDIISDLDAIRDGAAKGETAIQEHQSLADYYNKSQVDSKLAQKQDTLTIDHTPTINSGNPISSGAVYDLQQYTINGLNGKQATLTFDNMPTEGSANPVTSGGIYTAIVNSRGILFIEVDELPTPSASTVGAVYIIKKDEYTYEWYVTIYDQYATPPEYKWRKVNTNSIDLSDYYTIEQVDALLQALADSKQDKLNFATDAECEAAAEELT